MFSVVRTLICKDTVLLARWLVEQAVTGKIRGIAVAVRLLDGSDDVLFTGAYRQRPGHAIAAAGHMHWLAVNQPERAE